MRTDAIRQRIAYEAARILQEQGGEPDYFNATRKAAEKLSIKGTRNFPKKAEVQQALLTQQELFNTRPHAATLHELRLVAVEAMKSFETFNPRLTGPVVDGTADRYSPIRLFLFTDSAEQVAMNLTDKNIPWHSGERRIHFADGGKNGFPCLQFEAGETSIELVILPPASLSNPPINPVSERPDRGIGRTQLDELIQTSGV